MTRQALQFPEPSFRADEATGTRPIQRVSADLASASPLAFARHLLAAGRAQAALDILEREIVSGRESAELQFWVGRAAFGLRNFVRAQRALSRAVALSPLDAEPQRWLARVLMRRGNALAAMRVWKRSSEMSMQSQDTWDIGERPTDLGAMEFDDAEFEDSVNEEPPTTEWIPSGGRSQSE